MTVKELKILIDRICNSETENLNVMVSIEFEGSRNVVETDILDISVWNLVNGKSQLVFVWDI